MSNIRIYCKPEQIAASITIDDTGVIHKIKNVLRRKPGEIISVFDGAGNEYLFSVLSLSKKVLTLKRLRLERSVSASDTHITLAFPLVQENKIDFLLQKATELGLSRFIPFFSARSLRPVRMIQKQKRWRTIILEAARQSERLWVPLLEPAIDFKKLIQQEYSCKIAGAINGVSLSKCMSRDAKRILYVIGPTGDFTSSEYKQLAQAGFGFLKLSRNLLRTETAAILGVGLINYFLQTEK